MTYGPSGPGCKGAGTFWSAYCGNRDEAVEGVIDADPVAAAVRAVMTERTEWTGTASDLLGALGEAAGERIVKSKTWPDSPRALSGRLRRAATFLRKIGIEVSFEREGRARTRVIHITAAGADAVPERGGAQPSAPSAPRSKSSLCNGFAAPDPRTIANDADGRPSGPADTVRANPLKSDGRTDADGADANCAAHSEPEKNGSHQLEGKVMSAAEALRAARDAGIGLHVDGVDLVLEASAPPPAAVLDLLTRHKADLIILLQQPASLDAFVAKAVAELPSGATIQALMEPTGMSWFPVAHRLADAGVAVIRVKGQRVRALRRYLSEHVKTDLADAHVLAAMPLFGGPGFDPVHIPAPKSHALQRLTKQRARFQDAVASAKRRLLDLVRWASPNLEAVLPDLRTRLSLALLRAWFDPTAILKARHSTLTSFIARSASGNHPHSGPFVDTLVDGLKRAARDALALHGGHVDFAELQAEVATEVGILIADLDAIAGLEHRIAALYAEIHLSDALRTLPGIGPHLAPVLIGVLHIPELELAVVLKTEVEGGVGVKAWFVEASGKTKGADETTHTVKLVWSRSVQATSRLASATPNSSKSKSKRRIRIRARMTSQGLCARDGSRHVLSAHPLAARYSGSPA